MPNSSGGASARLSDPDRDFGGPADPGTFDPGACSSRGDAVVFGTAENFAYEIVGYIDEDPSRASELVANGRVVGTPADIEALVARHHVDRLVVGMSDRRGRLPVRELLRAKLRGVRVEDVNTMYERLTGKLLVEDLRPSWLIFSDDFRASRLTR